VPKGGVTIRIERALGGAEGGDLAEQALARVRAEVDLEEDEVAALGVGAGGLVDAVGAVLEL
jgi:hypothetical protein